MESGDEMGEEDGRDVEEKKLHGSAMNSSKVKKYEQIISRTEQ